jgi:hypothetical protein
MQKCIQSKQTDVKTIPVYDDIVVRTPEEDK